MTKKDFIALADVFRKTKWSASEPNAAMILQWVLDRDMVASVCAATNPRFNRERWIAYIDGECGPNGGEVKK